MDLYSEFSESRMITNEVNCFLRWFRTVASTKCAKNWSILENYVNKKYMFLYSSDHDNGSKDNFSIFHLPTLYDNDTKTRYTLDKSFLFVVMVEYSAYLFSKKLNNPF